MGDKNTTLDSIRELLDTHFEGDDDTERRYSQRTRKARRDLQLCAAARRCLELVLPEELIARGVTTAEVWSVEPFPDAGRLVAVVAVDLSELEHTRSLLVELRADLRRQVAESVQRRRAPELVLQAVAKPEDADG